VSLVLEALKKLDREKGRDERGFVVMAAAPWPSRTARRWPAWAALGVATAGAVVAVMALRTSPAPPSRPEPPATSVAAPAPAPALVRSEPPTPVPRSASARVAPKAAVETPPVAAAVVPPARAATPDPGPRLQAISERDGQPIAIINDHLVRVGDEVDGIRVIAIRVDEVDIEVRGRRTTLRF
jgi:hypothetical protein